VTDTQTSAVCDPALAELLMRDLCFSRRASERCWNLQRQGRMTLVAPLTGQEAAVCGMLRGLDLATDWVVPYYRELLGLGALGDDLFETVVAFWRGHPDGSRIPDGVHCLPPQIALGSQLPHAAGLAWGLRLRGDPGVVLAFTGDGATSQGDFSEALNLAGTRRLPLVVAVINNGWAISTPSADQTAAESFAAKGAAFGIPGVIVDGNDVLAVVGAVREARAHAASGAGPVLLELQTYRMGAHTTSDDPTRYVPPEELAAWAARDPIEQFRTQLTAAGQWDDARHEAVLAAVEARLERIVDAALARPVDPADTLDHLEATPSPRLLEQQRDLTQRISRAAARQEGRPE
jgi:pyruvate dehydrogenase E1 component alpha subunit